MIHSFHDKNEWANSPEHEEFLLEVYRGMFPSMVGNVKITVNCDAQHMGVDRLLVLGNNATIRIDEKLRAKDYDDFLLEFVSNTKTRAPGWMDKDLAIDYLAYAFLPTRRCYLLPWHPLRRVWLLARERWIGSRPVKVAKNNGYDTLSVAIPTWELLREVREALTFIPPQVSGEKEEAA